MILLNTTVSEHIVFFLLDCLTLIKASQGGIVNIWNFSLKVFFERCKNGHIAVGIVGIISVLIIRLLSYNLTGAVILIPMFICHN